MITIEKKFNFGINILDDLIEWVINYKKIDSIDCMAFNVNLDYVLYLFKKYPRLEKFHIYSNTENITYSEKSWEEVNKLIKANKIQFCHIEADKSIVHAKVYRFLKEGKVVFGAIGSPNFTRHSNQNFEFLYYLDDPEHIDEIWSDMKKSFHDFNIACKREVPDQILAGSEVTSEVDEKFLNGLWLHQKGILKWLSKREKAIINIPPGCGKTKIALTYLKFLYEKYPDLTTIVLVPTKTLISQWLLQLKENEIQSFEGEVHWDNLSHYFGNPDKRAMVTLYNPRFFSEYNDLLLHLEITQPKLAIISDECHNLYGNIDKYQKFIEDYHNSINKTVFQIGLSATIDSFRVDEMNKYIESMGGRDNIYEISFQSIYSRWNNKNATPILKELNYIPIKYYLNQSEMQIYNDLSKKVAAQTGMKNLHHDDVFSAAIERARWVRSLDGGITALKKYLNSNMTIFRKGSTIIFVQTNKIAEEIRDYITKNPQWDNNSSAYVFDSNRSELYRDYALRQFRQNHGYCLIAEKMLSEGFDIPKISRVILHGSDKSERDWIQKIGRALRYDIENPEAVAEIVDIVFCDPQKNPLPLEKERYETLKSISKN
jgi:superfamily II DNA or RNA helicase